MNVEDMFDDADERRPYPPPFLTPEQAAVCPPGMYDVLDLHDHTITPLPRPQCGPGRVRLLGAITCPDSRAQGQVTNPVADAPGVGRQMLCGPITWEAMALCEVFNDPQLEHDAAMWLVRSWLAVHPGAAQQLAKDLESDLAGPSPEQERMQAIAREALNHHHAGPLGMGCRVSHAHLAGPVTSEPPTSPQASPARTTRRNPR